MAFARLLAALGSVGLGAQAFTLPATKPLPVAGVRAPALRPPSSLPKASQWQDSPSPAALLVACGAVAALAARGLRGEGKITMRYRKLYGGQGKADPTAIYGPQYNGPKLDYAIHRKKTINRLRNGEQRTVPKMGGSYSRNKDMMRSLTTQVIRYGRIRTTYGRAMAVQSFVDRMITLGKRGDELSRREAEEWMIDADLVENLFKLAPDRYAGKNKDFTQVTRTMFSKFWNEMAYIELV